MLTITPSSSTKNVLAQSVHRAEIEKNLGADKYLALRRASEKSGHLEDGETEAQGGEGVHRGSHGKLGAERRLGHD